MPNEVNAVLYARVSLINDAKTSHLNQMREMKAFAKRQGFNVVGEFMELGKSAYKLTVHRPELEKAMHLIETGQANALVVWKLDRLSRSMVEFPKLNGRLTEAGARLYSVTETFLNVDDDFIAGFMKQVLNMMGELEVKGIQERMLGFHRGRKESGAVPIGPRPYGYTRPEKGDDDWIKGGTLIIKDDEAAIIREVANRVIEGEALRAIARDLQSRGIPTAKGNRWSHSTLRTFLLSTTTAGMMKDGTPSDAWQPILDVETWETVASILNDPNRTSHINGGRDARKLKHLLPGLMKCGRCGGRMVTMSHTRGRQYGCQSCELSIMAEPTDEFVTSWIMDNITESQWQSMLTQGRANESQVAEQLQERIDDAWIEYYGTDESMRPSRKAFDALIANLTAQMEAAQSEPAIKLPNVANLHTGWSGMTNAERREVINAAIDGITVLPYAKGQTGNKRIAIRAA